MLPPWEQDMLYIVLYKHSYDQTKLALYFWLEFFLAYFSVGAQKVKFTCMQFRQFCQDKSRDGWVFSNLLYVHATP